MHFIKLIRPKQWLKNLMLFFPPLFGGILFPAGNLTILIVPFLAFCLASSANYAINDVLDAEKDACHPVKKKRPIPSREIQPQTALILAGFFLILSAIVSVNISFSFFLVLLVYFVLSSAYSLKFKNIPVVDIFCISAGFLLRLHAGGIVFGVPISDWLFLTVFLFSIFLSLGKRIAEKQLLQDECAQHRPVLQDYPLGFIQGTMYMTGATVLVTYAMYVVAHPGLLYTIPLCCFGLFRYMYRVIKDSAGDPTEAMLQDKVLLAVSLLWLFMVGWGIYR